MSTLSPIETLDRGLVDFADLNLKRQAYKQLGAPDRTALQGLADRCAMILGYFTHQDFTGRIGHDVSLQETHGVLVANLTNQQKKIQKLVSALPPISRSDSPLGSRDVERLSSSHHAVHQEPLYVGIVRNALIELEAGREKQGLANIRVLEKSNPEIAKRIFGEVYKAAGSPTRKSQPKIAHDHFGRVAFYGEEKRNVALSIKVAAVKTVLTDLTTAPKLKPAFVKAKPTDTERRQFLTTVWQDALKILKAGKYTNSRDEVVYLDTSRSVSGTVAFPEPSTRVVHNTNPSQQLCVVGQDCLEVAEQFVRSGKRVSVLNMANDKTPGGGVRTGAAAQEEDLFRRTGLTDALSTSKLNGKQPTDFYPISTKAGTAGVLYTSDVPVFRAGRNQGYALLDDPFEINVLSVAARRNPPLVQGRLQKADEAEMDRKIYTMLEAAHQNGDQVVILSALGCGAFHNPPEHVSECFRYIVKNFFPGAFETVVFAIIDDHNAKGKDGNFLPFARQFAQDGARVISGTGKTMTAEEIGTVEELDDSLEQLSSSSVNSDEEETSPRVSRRGVRSSTIALDEVEDVTQSPESHLKALGSLSVQHRYMPFANTGADSRTAFLGTYQPCKIRFDGQVFDCIEAAFNAGRDPKRKAEFVGMTGEQAFNHRTSVTIAPGWFKRNEEHMRNVLFAAYKQNPHLQKLLLATGNAFLVMHSKDNFWGDNMNTTGQNKLGILLMELRGKLGGTGLVTKIPPGYYKYAGVEEGLDESPRLASRESASRVSSPHIAHLRVLARLAKDHGFISFYDKRDPKTEFLGNFHLRDLTIGKHTFKCGEAAFQAGKDPKQAAKFVGKDGDGAFKEGRKVTATSDWISGSRNVAHMRFVLAEKFKDLQLQELLLATGDAYLLEHCPQGRDAFWADNGDGTGKNMLGRLLMELRGNLGGTGVVAKLPADAYTKLAQRRL